MSFKKIIGLCNQHGLLKINNFHDTIDSLQNSFRVGPTGILLLHNLKSEWFYNILNNKENTVFYNTHIFEDTFDFVKDICIAKLPFGIAEKVVIKNEAANTNQIDGSAEFHKKAPSENVLDFAQYFNDFDCFKCTMFISPAESTHYFHQWQRQRRVWWRKFSATPGRYFLTDIQVNEEDASQNVEIRANYPWGVQVIEKINLHSTNHPNLTDEQLQNRDGRLKVNAHYLTSTISIPTMYLNIICDAYEELMFDDEPRVSFRFHRKLAPYKVSFSVAAKSSSNEELSDLALYLCKKLKSNNISSLLLPSASKYTLENQYKQYDQLGIPYTVVLNESTLKNGVISLRSRDTTLKEQVHVAELPSYVELLFKNY